MQRRYDRIDLAALVVSTLVHVALITAALWKISEPIWTDNKQPIDDPTTELAAQEQEQLRPVLQRLSDPDTLAPPQDNDPLPALPKLQERSLAFPHAPEPKPYHRLAEKTSRDTSTGNDDLLKGMLTQHLERMPAGPLDNLHGGEALTDEIVDKHQQEWQLAAYHFEWLNGLQRTYAQSWKAQFGAAVTNTRLVLLVEVDSRRNIHFRRILEGSGVAALDQAISTSLKLKPPTRVPPTDTLTGSIPFVVYLEKPRK